MKTRAIRGVRRKKQTSVRKRRPEPVEDFYDPGEDVTYMYRGGGILFHTSSKRRALAHVAPLVADATR